MGTFSQWSKTRKVAPLAWVCGDEPALVREVVSVYRATCPGDRQLTVTAGEVPDRDVWDAALSDSPTRLLVIRHADKLGDLAPMAALAAGASATGLRVVFVSEAGDFAKVDAGGKKVLAPHLEALKDSKHGQLVRCCAPTRAEDRAALVASWWPGADTGHAVLVLRLCGGDLTLAREACDKATRAGLAPEAKHAGLVCMPEPGAGFADPLIAGDKAAAMAAAYQATPDETGAGIGLLAARLPVLAEIHDAQQGGATPGQLPSVLRHIDRFLLHLLARYAGPYDKARVAREREVLAMAEHYWRGGATEGVAVTVVALW
jgi:hypothetical protein